MRNTPLFIFYLQVPSLLSFFDSPRLVLRKQLTFDRSSSFLISRWPLPFSVLWCICFIYIYIDLFLYLFLIALPTYMSMYTLVSLLHKHTRQDWQWFFFDYTFKRLSVVTARASSRCIQLTHLNLAFYCLCPRGFRLFSAFGCPRALPMPKRRSRWGGEAEGETKRKEKKTKAKQREGYQI